MQRLLARHVGLFKVFGIGLAVFFAGSAVTHYTANALLLDVEELASSTDEGDDDDADEDQDEDQDEGGARAKPSPAPEGLANIASRKRSSAEAIVGGNVFCPTCSAVEEPIDADAPVLASTGEVPSQLPLRLLATMESDDPMWSMATIQDLDNNALGPFATNDQLRPGVTILSVERGRVVLLNQGRREYIMMGGEAPKVTPRPTLASTPKPTPQSAPRGKSIEIDGAAQAINCSGSNCTVDRSFVEQLLKNPAQLMTQARMSPVDGGFKVSRVRSGSLATMIGLENGDVLREINGNKLGDMDAAIGLYNKLRRASHLSVVIERGGAVITKDISIK